MNLFLRRNCSVILVALAFLVAPGVFAQVDAPTILGALSDEPPKTVWVGNREIVVYQAAQNRLLRQQTRFSEVTLYYEHPPTVRSRANGRIDVRINPSFGSPGKKLVQFTLIPVEIDRASLLAEIKKIDPYVRPENILPVQIFGLEVELLGIVTPAFQQEGGTAFNRTFSVDVPVDSARAQELADALQNGATIRVGYVRFFKLSQLISTSLKWSSVKNTKTFRDYNGPSGPTYITAAQVVDATLSILSEMKVFHWEETDARGSGGATTKDYGSYIDKILDRFISSRASKMVDFDGWVNTRRFDVPVSDFQKVVDVTRSIATDAKNLNNNEWCRKYSDQLKTLDEAASSRNSPASLGLKIGIPKILGFGLDAKESTVSSSSKKTYDKLSATEDCGKKLVENNYKYEWAGEKYVPKTIKVYEVNKAAGQIEDLEEFTIYRIGQQFKTNEWSISSN